MVEMSVLCCNVAMFVCVAACTIKSKTTAGFMTKLLPNYTTIHSMYDTLMLRVTIFLT